MIDIVTWLRGERDWPDGTEVAKSIAATEIETLRVALAAERERCARLERLVQIMIDEDPNDLAADGGVTVLDVWRKQAAAAIRKDE